MTAEPKTFPNHRSTIAPEDLLQGIEVIDDLFLELIDRDTEIQKHWTGCEWAEGPVYFPEGDYVLWSDVPNDRILKFDAHSRDTTVFREPCNNTNGHFRDQQGQLVSCEHAANRISRTAPDGSVTCLVDNWQGKRLNSPNDLVVKSDGTIWFTDPPYGILSDREGNQRESELEGNFTYRFDPKSKELSIVDNVADRPNGLAFSPDETMLYLADTGAPRDITVFNVAKDAATLSNRRLFAKVRPGAADGLRVDERGNIWTSARDGVQCYSPNGSLLGKILIPEQATANLVFGDKDGKRIYICGDTSLYSVRVKVAGAGRYW
ncbi:MAG: gluconolactonase [Chloroflexi bacterium]|jgi:gluconolactonase|nr:gluconolactonase [Chloroflexota bacterium]MDP7089494.1 SMP-30/gluconolactonase/LRE family protein [Dehalococcoidia bacterium]|tara:strand:- start:199 stop:1158 length:960 start_codon:yes stop_codon:yes gene_type:complete